MAVDQAKIIKLIVEQLYADRNNITLEDSFM